ncbi:hypothetical protein PoB_001739400 [Plakobranchus ocellatus]|uniref:Uncharacterized protein n=1 Tax=Plakobranchus ocellatus TaxID=259542 RepID=A0AAV3Z8Z2_9GAST|nr:hypothetical protein PoB_001739400 [Plakobranchus ocellatus]
MHRTTGRIFNQLEPTLKTRSQAYPSRRIQSVSAARALHGKDNNNANGLKRDSLHDRGQDNRGASLTLGWLAKQQCPPATREHLPVKRRFYAVCACTSFPCLIH